jgi:maltose-binding protein MalE
LEEELMKTRSFAVFVLAISALGLAMAASEEKFGVKVYDGAKYDADTSQFIGAAMKVEAACYRTDAPAAQVNEFYRKQPGTTEVHTSARGGMFKKGDISITIQNPWMNMKSHQQMKDTLISIVKH